MKTETCTTEEINCFVSDCIPGGGWVGKSPSIQESPCETRSLLSVRHLKLSAYKSC